MPEFVHLHLHTIYSVLDGAVKLEQLVEQVKKWAVPAVAITDHGNLYGTFAFWSLARSENVLPILGCEFYFTENRNIKNRSQPIYHQLLLAKDKTGFKNLMMLSSLSFLEGFYQKPRIDRELIEKYSEGLIATSSCLQGEIPQAILQGDIEKAKQLIKWWADRFPGRFYLELQRHGIPEQDKVNRVLFTLSRELGIPLVATNDVHYLTAQDAEAHDILLCIQTGSRRDQPNRLKFATSEFYLKTPEQMYELFRDIPEAVTNTVKIAKQVSDIELNRDVVFPTVNLPQGYKSHDEYLRKLVYDGAKQRYGSEIPEKIRERIEYELSTISKMGFSPYFLIVREIIDIAKQIGAKVGPGRGSAAGSIVAYCLGITQIDPLKYDLLFERFLNPERVSLPDIDIDFDDEHRDLLIEKVAHRYGKEHVAQIITFMRIASRTAVRDVGRVMGLPQAVINELASLIPEEAPQQPMPISKARKEVRNIQDMERNNTKVKECLDMAERIEGTIRQTGVHAAGVVIAAEPLVNLIPLAVHKDSLFPITQWEHVWLEEAGVLKIDLLGLANLTIISDTLELIRSRHGISIDINKIPLDDQKTLELFQRGETVGVFQFESEGMRQYLRKLKPTTFEDIVAMVALYRPGPLQYIQEFIDRKHGRKPVEYPHPSLEPVLKETYGIMVYQEQLMRVAQKLAGFSLGKADILRKAVAKKQKELLEKFKDDFISGCVNNGIDKSLAEKIFSDIEKFGLYGFNKSHAVAYAFLAFQTAYLKAHYPVEYMCSLLNSFMKRKKAEELLPYFNECRRMGIYILPPDINESEIGFTIAGEKAIRFGLGAIKNVGDAVAEEIITERKKEGPFKSIFDLARRVSKVNKRVLESLVLSGALDSFGFPREAYFENLKSRPESAIEYASRMSKKNTRSPRITQGMSTLFQVKLSSSASQDPSLPDEVERWDVIKRLRKEREVLGFFVSGHPLDNYIDLLRLIPEIKSVSQLLRESLEDPVQLVYGVVVDIDDKMSRQKKKYWEVTIEDYESMVSFRVFDEDYSLLLGGISIGDPVLVACKVEGHPDERLTIRPMEIYKIDEVLQEDNNWWAILRIPLELCTEQLASSLLKSGDEAGKGDTGMKCKLVFEIYDDGQTLKWISEKLSTVSPAMIRNLQVQNGKISIVLHSSFLSKIKRNLTKSGNN